MKKPAFLIFFFVACLTCFSQEQVSSVEKQFIKFYFEGERNKVLEDYNKALIDYNRCIDLIPEEAAPYYQIGKIELYVFHELDNAEYYINEAILLDPTNEWYFYDLLTIYGIQNDIESQLEVYLNLIKIKEENPVYYFEAIQLLKDLEKYREAERFIKKTEKKFGSTSDLLLLLKDVYVAQDNFREAEKIGKKLIERSVEFYTVLAELYMYFSEYEKAINVYENLLKKDPEHPQATLALYKIYSNKQDANLQEKYLEKIAINENINIEIKKEIFYSLLVDNKIKDSKSFKRSLNKIIATHPKESLFHLILGDLNGKDGNYNKAIHHYQLSLYSGLIKDDYIYNKLIEIYFQKEEIDSVLRTSDLAIERFPFGPEFYYYKALALIKQGRHQNCIDVLLKGKDFVFDNSLLLSDFYALMGDAYHDLNKNKLSDGAYEDALEHNPNNTFVLNNYSYYLSNREENLSLAKTMITKCIELTSESPQSSYLDTYAWVLYKMGEYNLARDQIEKALMLNQNSPVLLDHYGDILYQLGFLKQALEEWKKAYQLDQDNLELEKKINNLMLNE